MRIYQLSPIKKEEEPVYILGAPPEANVHKGKEEETGFVSFSLSPEDAERGRQIISSPQEKEGFLTGAMRGFAHTLAGSIPSQMGTSLAMERTGEAIVKKSDDDPWVVNHLLSAGYTAEQIAAMSPEERRRNVPMMLLEQLKQSGAKTPDITRHAELREGTGLRDALEKGLTAVGKWGEETFKGQDPTVDKDGYLKTIAHSVVSSLPYGLAARVPMILGSMAAGPVGAATAMFLPMVWEARMESTDTFRRGKQKGMTDEEAFKAAHFTERTNHGILTGSNLAQSFITSQQLNLSDKVLDATLRFIPGAKLLPKGGRKFLAKGFLGVVDGLFNIGEEGAQTVTQSIATDDPLNKQDLAVAMGSGFLTGTGMSVVSGIGGEAKDSGMERKAVKEYYEKKIGDVTGDERDAAMLKLGLKQEDFLPENVKKLYEKMAAETFVDQAVKKYREDKANWVATPIQASPNSSEYLGTVGLKREIAPPSEGSAKVALGLPEVVTTDNARDVLNTFIVQSRILEAMKQAGDTPRKDPVERIRSSRSGMDDSILDSAFLHSVNTQGVKIDDDAMRVNGGKMIVDFYDRYGGKPGIRETNAFLGEMWDTFSQQGIPLGDRSEFIAANGEAVKKGFGKTKESVFGLVRDGLINDLRNATDFAERESIKQKLANIRGAKTTKDSESAALSMAQAIALRAKKEQGQYLGDGFENDPRNVNTPENGEETLPQGVTSTLGYDGQRMAEQELEKQAAKEPDEAPSMIDALMEVFGLDEQSMDRLYRDMPFRNDGGDPDAHIVAALSMIEDAAKSLEWTDSNGVKHNSFKENPRLFLDISSSLVGRVRDRYEAQRKERREREGMSLDEWRKLPKEVRDAEAFWEELAVPRLNSDEARSFRQATAREYGVPLDLVNAITDRMDESLDFSRLVYDDFGKELFGERPRSHFAKLVAHYEFLSERIEQIEQRISSLKLDAEQGIPFVTNGREVIALGEKKVSDHQKTMNSLLGEMQEMAAINSGDYVDARAEIGDQVPLSKDVRDLLEKESDYAQPETKNVFQMEADVKALLAESMEENGLGRDMADRIYDEVMREVLDTSNVKTVIDNLTEASKEARWTAKDSYIAPEIMKKQFAEAKNKERFVDQLMEMADRAGVPSQSVDGIRDMDLATMGEILIEAIADRNRFNYLAGHAIPLFLKKNRHILKEMYRAGREAPQEQATQSLGDKIQEVVARGEGKSLLPAQTQEVAAEPVADPAQEAPVGKTAEDGTILAEKLFGAEAIAKEEEKRIPVLTEEERLRREQIEKDAAPASEWGKLMSWLWDPRADKPVAARDILKENFEFISGQETIAHDSVSAIMDYVKDAKNDFTNEKLMEVFKYGHDVTLPSNIVPEAIRSHVENIRKVVGSVIAVRAQNAMEGGSRSFGEILTRTRRDLRTDKREDAYYSPTTEQIAEFAVDHVEAMKKRRAEEIAQKTKPIISDIVEGMRSQGVNDIDMAEVEARAKKLAETQATPIPSPEATIVYAKRLLNGDVMKDIPVEAMPKYMQRFLNFSPDPAVQLYTNVRTLIRDTASKLVEKRMLEQTALVKDVATPGFVEMTGDQYKGLKGKFVEASVAAELQKEEKARSQMVQGYRMLHSLFKHNKIILSTTSYVNNYFGNFFLMRIGGVPFSYSVSTHVDRAKDIARSVLNGKMDGKLYEAVSNGLFLGTMTNSEIAMSDGDLGQVLAAKDFNALNKVIFKIASLFENNKVAHGGRTLYESIEKTHRYTAYRYFTDKMGMSPKEAVREVNNALFDYQDLPKGVKFLRDTGVPFISFPYLAGKSLLRNSVKRPASVAIAILSGTLLREVVRGITKKELELDNWIPFWSLLDPFQRTNTRFNEEPTASVRGEFALGGPMMSVVEAARGKTFFGDYPTRKPGENPVAAGVKHFLSTMAPSAVMSAVRNKDSVEAGRQSAGEAILRNFGIKVRGTDANRLKRDLGTLWYREQEIVKEHQEWLRGGERTPEQIRKRETIYLSRLAKLNNNRKKLIDQYHDPWSQVYGIGKVD